MRVIRLKLWDIRVADSVTAQNKPQLKAIEGGRDRPDALSPLASALRTLKLEAEGLSALKKDLDGPLGDHFQQAVEILKLAEGRVIISGIGKSGHIGQKVAATFASTGTPSFFVHPSEASHGDLGMIRPEDVILAMSWSGETVELKNIITYSRRFSVAAYFCDVPEQISTWSTV